MLATGSSLTVLAVVPFLGAGRKRLAHDAREFLRSAGSASPASKPGKSTPNFDEMVLTDALDVAPSTLVVYAEHPIPDKASHRRSRCREITMWASKARAPVRSVRRAPNQDSSRRRP